MAPLDVPALLAVNAADEPTQEARYQAFRGKRVLWLTCFYTSRYFDGLRPAISRVVEMGARLFVVFSPSDADKELCTRMVDLGLVAREDAIICEMEEGDTAQNIINAVKAKGCEIDAVFSPHEHCQTLVGELAETLQFPGNKKQSYINARNKRASRDVCAAANIPVPKYFYVEHRENLEAIGAQVGYPVVLKPTTGSASAGVYKCANYTELASKFDMVTEELKTNPLFTWNLGSPVGMLVESYMDGDEFDVDLLMWNGECVYGGCIDNWATMEPTFLETGSNCPSLCQSEKRKELVDYAVACVIALGFTQGCFHVECKYTINTMLRAGPGDTKRGQPMLIEVNPRMGGGRTRLFYQEVYGVDVFENFILSACGIPINPPRSKEPLCGIADYFFCAEKTGILLNTRFLDHIRGHPNVLLCATTKNAGDKVNGSDLGIPDWVGFMTVKCDTIDEAMEFIVKLLQSVEIPIMADGETKPAAAQQPAPVSAEVTAN